MLRSASGVNAGATNLEGTIWETKTPGFDGSIIRTVLLCDRRLTGFPPSTGIYLAAGEGGKLFKTSTNIQSYNSESAWTSVTSSFGTTAIYDSHQGAGNYVYLVGASGKIGRSLQTSDLSTWVQVTSSFDITPILAITGNDWIYVAVGQGGKLATKNDYSGAVTTAWTQRANPFGTTTINGVTVRPRTEFEPDRFVAVADDGLLAFWDTEGIDAGSDAAIYSVPWISRTSSFGSSNIYDVEWSPYIRKFVAVGAGGKISTSEDGYTWTQVSNPPFGLSDIYTVTSTGLFGGLFIAAGTAGKLATSPNGSDWTLQTSGFSGVQEIHSVHGNSTTVIAGGDAGLVSITPVPELIDTPIYVPPPPPFVPPLGTGGSVVDVTDYLGTGETWRVHTFTNSGSFTVVNGGTMSCLNVGGGGGGHGGQAGIFGSGGHGGSVVPSTHTFVPGIYTVTVGTGGAGGAYSGAPSGVGGSSSIVGTGVSATAAGGAGRSSSENGQDGIGASGSGRTGISSAITGTELRLGGGGGYALNVGNRGFVDGGGPGGDVSVNLGSPGQASTGGGGGGSYNSSNPGRAGGSGLVIIAYKLS